MERREEEDAPLAVVALDVETGPRLSERLVREPPPLVAFVAVCGASARLLPRAGVGMSWTKNK